MRRPTWTAARSSAPFSGTVMEVHIAGGDVVAVGGSERAAMLSSSDASAPMQIPLSPP